MKSSASGGINRVAHAFVLVLAFSAAMATAGQSSGTPQNAPPADPEPHRWRRSTEPAPAAAEPASVANNSPANPDRERSDAVRVSAPLDEFGQPRSAPVAIPAQGRDLPAIPDQLTIKPGTYLTVRVDQPLSSDHNQPGDAFTATLIKPVVVDGMVVAQRGQTIAGAVVEAQKAGRVQGVSRLAVQLTELTLVDGQQMPIRTQLVNRTGPTSAGRDGGAVAATAATGAAIGAMADWGTGAAIGAGAGAVVGLVGVLLTRGHETLIVPEMMLTFRVEAPVAIATSRAPQAFRYVEPEDYAQASLASRPAPPIPQQPPPYFGPAFFYGPAFYPGYWGPGYWGPGAGIYFGRSFYWGGRGYYRARWH